MEKKTKILIADDSALMRRSLRKMLEDRGFDVAGTARDGEDVLVKAEQLKPDVITLDINMPRMDGITALRKLLKKNIAPIIMVSSLTQSGANTTIKALELGAFDCVGKPGGTVSADMSSVALDLERKIREAAASGILDRLRMERRKTTRVTVSKPSLKKDDKKGKIEKSETRFVRSSTFKAIAIGISTGGPKTIFDVLPNIPPNINAAIFMVQHMPPNFTAQFAARIDRSCKLKCEEVKGGTIVKPGVIYLGKGGYHLNLIKKASGDVVIRTPTRPPHLFVPSVDIMMNSVFNVYGKSTIGVLMTGMGDDGANAMVNIKKGGGKTIAESRESAIVWGMPGEAYNRGGVDLLKPSWEIADAILSFL